LGLLARLHMYIVMISTTAHPSLSTRPHRLIVVRSLESRGNLHSVLRLVRRFLGLLPRLLELDEFCRQHRVDRHRSMYDSPPMVGTGCPPASNSFCVKPSRLSTGDSIVLSLSSFFGRAKYSRPRRSTCCWSLGGTCTRWIVERMYPPVRKLNASQLCYQRFPVS